jgi:hypothetical protein
MTTERCNMTTPNNTSSAPTPIEWLRLRATAPRPPAFKARAPRPPAAIKPEPTKTKPAKRKSRKDSAGELPVSREVGLGLLQRLEEFARDTTPSERHALRAEFKGQDWVMIAVFSQRDLAKIRASFGPTEEALGKLQVARRKLRTGTEPK